MGTNGLAWARFERHAKGWRCVAQDLLLRAEEVPDTLRQCLDELDGRENLRQDGRIILVIPRHEVTTRILTLPSQDRGEMDSMLRLSAEEFVPYPAEELIIDHCTLEKLPNGESRVLAAFAHRDTIDRLVAACEALTVQPEQVVLSTACLVRLKPSDKGETAAVLLQPGGMEVAVFRDGVLVYSRGISSPVDWQGVCRDPEMPVGGGGVIQDTAADELAAEIRSSLSAYRREVGADSSDCRILIGAESCDTTALCRALEGRLNLSCAPFPMGVPIPGVVTPCPSGAGAPVWCAAGVLAEDAQGTVIDLTPERLRTVARGRRLTGMLSRLAVMLGIALVFLFVAYRIEVSRREAYIADLERQVQSLEPRAKGIAEMREQLNILRRQVDRSGSILEQLAAVVSAVPVDRVNITRVSLNRNEGITVWGRAKTVDDVAEFAQNLRAQGDRNAALAFFAAARSLYEQKAMEQNLEVFTYQIDIPRTPPEEEDRNEPRTR